MTIQTFDVTAITVHDTFFPQQTNFSSDTAPTEDNVNEKFVQQEAAKIAGALLRLGVDANDIDEDGAAYVNCASQLERMVAVRCTRSMTHWDGAVVQAWEAENKAWFDALEEFGLEALGDSALLPESDNNPIGPTTHIKEYDLDTGDPGDASSLVPRLRRDDQL